MQPFLQRVLCADDDASTRALMQLWLERQGYEVETVETSGEVLRLAEQRAFDLYLLDDWFPDGRGKDLIQALRTLDPNTPIVFLSGDVRQANQVEILSLGAQAFFTKPVELDEITATIAQLISTAEQEQSVYVPTVYGCDKNHTGGEVKE
jgi:DNA-binding response OmpR family regulator